MKVKLWGTRGSLPSPSTPLELENKIKDLFQSFFDSGYQSQKDISTFLSQLPLHRYGGYGGNTPCCQITHEDQVLIIDGGSGLRSLGYELLQGPCGKGQGEVHLLFTHFHWDHLMGLPFFTPLFIPGNQIHVYAVQKDLKEVFKTLFKKPYFPVPLEALGGTIHYHELEPRKPINFKNLKVTPYQLDHPDPCWGFKIEEGKKALAYCVDTECTRVSREKMGADLPLYQGVDLMIFDAQYTIMESMEKINWGHAAASIGLDIAMREEIKTVLFMHNDPASTDEKIALAESEARRYYRMQTREIQKEGRTPFEVKWIFAQEGMVLEV